MPPWAKRGSKHWEDTKNKAPGALRLLLDDPNPEVILSVLDLCRMSYFAQIEQAIRPECREDAGSRGLEDSVIPDEWFSSPDQKWLYDADTARYRLLDCLIAYFEWKHYEDWEAPAARREYPRTLIMVPIRNQQVAGSTPAGGSNQVAQFRRLFMRSGLVESFRHLVDGVAPILHSSA
jgi:hypothetical protein